MRNDGYFVKFGQMTLKWPSFDVLVFFLTIFLSKKVKMTVISMGAFDDQNDRQMAKTAYLNVKWRYFFSATNWSWIFYREFEHVCIMK